MAQAKCFPLPEPQSVDKLFSSENAGTLILAPQDVASGKPDRWQMAYEISFGCYIVPLPRKGRVFLAINNFVPDYEETGGGIARFDLGIQFLKLTAKLPDQAADQIILVSRSEKNPWYRRGAQSSPYSRKARTLDFGLSGWNGAHDSLNVIEQNDRQLEGRFHASADPSGANTFTDRRWWQLDEGFLDSYHIQLENRLISSLPATGEKAGGAPINVIANDFDAIVVKYASANVDIQGQVILCFSDCDTIEKIKISVVRRNLPD